MLSLTVEKNVRAVIASGSVAFWGHPHSLSEQHEHN